jgi:hypothetical protein
LVEGSSGVTGGRVLRDPVTVLDASLAKAQEAVTAASRKESELVGRAGELSRSLAVHRAEASGNAVLRNCESLAKSALVDIAVLEGVEGEWWLEQASFSATMLTCSRSLLHCVGVPERQEASAYG